MSSKLLIGALGIVGTLGLAAGSAFAQQYGDDHGEYHQELEVDHALEHQQLDVAHEGFHESEAAEYQRLSAMCGYAPSCQWIVQRRMDRQHRLEHMREWLNHEYQHEQTDAEHAAYHQATGPSYTIPYGTAYRTSYVVPPAPSYFVPRPYFRPARFRVRVGW